MMNYNYSRVGSNYEKYEFSYYFLNTASPSYVKDLRIDCKKVKHVYDKLRQRYGNKDTVKEYSLYRYNALELTIYKEGSSFCNEISDVAIKDLDLKNPENVYVKCQRKRKVSNDAFPCFYDLDSTIDKNDIIFKISSNTNIVISLCHENNKNHSIVKSLEDMGKKKNIKKNPYLWCEIKLVTDKKEMTKFLHDSIDYVTKLLNSS